MTTNLTPEQQVLEQFFDDFHNEQYPGEDADGVFELFVAGEILKHKNLSAEELASGVVDGPQDGGIDAMYLFLDGMLVQEDHPALAPSDSARRGPANPVIEMVILQSKNTYSWSETAWERLLSNLDRLLDNNVSLSQLEASFSEGIVEQISRYRALNQNLVRRLPRPSFAVHYVTRATVANITPSIVAKELQVRELVEGRLTRDARVDVSHLGAEDLYRLVGEPASVPGILKFRNLIREHNSYLGVATVEDYLSFVRDEDGELRDDLFDANVRDFEGDRGVNNAIRATLEEEGSEFWWQNNGVTILGADVRDQQSTLTVDQPLVVNGLQTTHVLHMVQRAGEMNISRLQQGVTIRVITTDDDETRDRVIDGTNRQTPVESVSLLASRPLQRDIERYFRSNGWYYERRKNQYKNQGRPARYRVSINQLAQAMMTLNLGLPDVARARPTTLLMQDSSRVFDANVDLDAYLRSIELLARVSEFLRTSSAKEILDEYSNSRFYVLAGVSMLAIGAKEFDSLKYAHNYTRLAGSASERLMGRALDRVKVLASDYQARNPDMKRDAIFKNAEFRKFFLSAVNDGSAEE